MKLGVLSQLPPPVHGSAIATQTFIRALLDLGHEVVLLDRRFSQTIEQVGNFSIRKILSLPSLWYRAVRLAFSRPDAIVIFATTSAGSFLVDYSVTAIFRLLRIPTSYYLHSVGFRRLHRRSLIFRKLVESFLGQADRIFCLSPIVANDVQNLAANVPIRLLPNAPTPIEVSEVRPDIPTFIFLANLIPEKGALDFLEVARLAYTSGLPARFVIRGFPASNAHFIKVNQICESLPNASYEGPVHGNEEKAALFSEASALIYPSRYPLEAQPLAILEAMSAGLPIIAYPTGGIPDLILDGQSGYLCEGVKEISSRVQRLCENPALRTSLGEKSRELFTSLYSARNYLDALSAYFPPQREGAV